MQRSHTHRWRSGVVAATVAIGALGISACGSSSKSKTSSTAGSPGTSTMNMSGTNSTMSMSGTSSTASASGAMPGKGKPAFVMGDKNFPEENTLGELYALALEAKGYTVTVKGNIGSTEETFNAMKSGTIDGYPEYDGTLLASEANDSTNYPSAATAAAATVKWATAHGYVFSTVTPFTDSDAIAVLSSYAKTNHLTSIGSLKRLGKKVVLAGPAEFATRYPDGLLGLHKAYGVYPTFKPTSIGTVYTLLDNGQANAVVGFTTDPPLVGTKYTVLKDTKAIFGWQNVGVVAKASIVKAEGPAFLQTINQVSALLTQPAIIDLNKAVEVEQESSATVAKAFLKANGLL